MRLLLGLLLVAQFALGAEAPTKYQFEYKVHLDLPKVGVLKVWIPAPIQDAYQSVVSQKVKSSLSWKATTEKTFGNHILFFEGKPTEKSLDIGVTYEVIRRANDGHKVDLAKTPLDNPDLYLKPTKKIPFTTTIRAIAEAETKPNMSDIDKASAFYDYVYRTMKYDKTGSGWGEGDAVWAGENKRGNCTDFHSLFIALNRTVGIPARFYMGFPIPPSKIEGEIPGYHCWAEAYTKSMGWIPVDASEAKQLSKQDYYFSHLPPNRIAFSLGRDLTLEPPQSGGELNYFIYPYVELDGKVMTDGIKKEFRFKKLNLVEPKS